MTIAGHAIAELQPIEIDPRPCDLCWRTIDQHECRDFGEGPEFFCYPDDDLVTRMEMADPRDRWRHTREQPPSEAFRNSDLSGYQEKAPPYRTPQSTIDAFWYVVRLEDPDYLIRWLKDHPLDAPHLHKIWGAKCSIAAA